MICWLNGEFLERSAAHLSASDRGFLLGDGLFETLRFEAGTLRRWARHEARLKAGLEALGIMADLPADMPSLAAELASRNALDAAIIRLTVSRGAGARGLDTAVGGDAAGASTVLVQAGPLPAPVSPRLVLIPAPRRAPLTLAAHFKMIGYGDSIHVRRAARASGADMGVMLSPTGHIACADSANVFWVTGRTVYTPSLDTGALNGTTRAAILDECARRDLHIEAGSFRTESLSSAEAVIVTNAVIGARPAASLDGRALRQDHPLVKLICDIERDAD